MDEYYTIEEVAAMFKVTRVTVYNWIRSGQLAYVQVGGRRRITKAAIEAFVKAGDVGERGAEIEAPELVAA